MQRTSAFSRTLSHLADRVSACRDCCFTSGADQYNRFMGRYSVPLAPEFTDFARLADGDLVLVSAAAPERAMAEALPFEDRSPVASLEAFA